MAVYRYDPNLDAMVDKDTGERMVQPGQPLRTPRVFGDYEGYQSPVDGRWIDGRVARREDMARHNCVDANDFAKPRKLKNERFAKKWGVEHLME